MQKKKQRTTVFDLFLFVQQVLLELDINKRLQKLLCRKLKTSRRQNTLHNVRLILHTQIQFNLISSKNPLMLYPYNLFLSLAASTPTCKPAVSASKAAYNSTISPWKRTSSGRFAGLPFCGHGKCFFFFKSVLNNLC